MKTSLLLTAVSLLLLVQNAVAGTSRMNIDSLPRCKDNQILRVPETLQGVLFVQGLSYLVSDSGISELPATPGVNPAIDLARLSSSGFCVKNELSFEDDKYVVYTTQMKRVTYGVFTGMTQFLFRVRLNKQTNEISMKFDSSKAGLLLDLIPSGGAGFGGWVRATK